MCLRFGILYNFRDKGREGKCWKEEGENLIGKERVGKWVGRKREGLLEGEE